MPLMSRFGGGKMRGLPVLTSFSRWSINLGYQLTKSGKRSIGDLRSHRSCKIIFLENDYIFYQCQDIWYRKTKQNKIWNGLGDLCEFQYYLRIFILIYSWDPRVYHIACHLMDIWYVTNNSLKGAVRYLSYTF